MTVLDYAVREDDYLIIPELLVRGANPAIVAEPEVGLTAVDKARQRIEVYWDGYPSEAAQKTLDLLESFEARGD